MSAAIALPEVRLKPRKALPFFSRHPWVYAGAVAHVEGEPADGDEVDLFSHAGHFVARGLFNSQSKIRVRLYSWTPDVPLDQLSAGDRISVTHTEALAIEMAAQAPAAKKGK